MIPVKGFDPSYITTEALEAHGFEMFGNYIDRSRSRRWELDVKQGEMAGIHWPA